LSLYKLYEELYKKLIAGEFVIDKTGKKII